MEHIIEKYNHLQSEIKVLEAQLREAEASLAAIQNRRDGDIPARIVKLEEQLGKIDDYLLKVKAFRKLAERNLESQNVQTIEAPAGYRVNLNRLRSWAMMIDPTSTNDPYAQRVYVVAKCDEHFLLQKQKEFKKRIQELRNDADVSLQSETARLADTIQTLTRDLGSIAKSDELTSFASEVIRENQQYWWETPPVVYTNPGAPSRAIAPGAYAAPFYLPQEDRPYLEKQFGRFYDSANSRVLLPLELETDKEFIMEVSCVSTRIKELDRALQNLLLNIIEGYPAGKNKIHILDGVRFNSSVLGSLKQLEDSFAIAPIPRNPEQMSAALEQIVSSFSDMDEVLELSDSVLDYNAGVEDEKQLPRTTLLLFGWPKSFTGRDQEYLTRIMTNYERYGISVISVSYQKLAGKEPQESSLPEYAAQNAIRIRMLPRDTMVQRGSEPSYRFAWYVLQKELLEEYVNSVRSHVLRSVSIGNEYPKRYDCVSLPRYRREYKKIELPFGVDGKDRAHSVSFENENFAAYLVGASRSGKSTLLHTLIAGLIREYHPDNVELWLADFKQLEFKKYINHCPPHVKYVLLDESPELVFDLIDKLTEKLMERKRLFARLGKERIDQLDPTALDEPLPVIFVILDEFSIMSQAIAESQTYKLRLQNLLAQGAAFGIRFLFSSQTFTTGIAGLTTTARAQIQQRISMKGTREEISETLELSANLKTEQVRNWIDALPPHYALAKYRTSADTLPKVMRVLVMYFPDYGVRDELIERIRQNMTAVEVYQPAAIQTYVDKHPVLVDGNQYHAYEKDRLLEQARTLHTSYRYHGDEVFLFPGRPRLMCDMKEVAVTPESRQNLLLLCPGSEQACGLSVALSSMRAFADQGKQVRVWAYERNPFYRSAKDQIWNQWETVTDLDEICGAIRSMKESLQQGGLQNEQLVVLIGFESICMDFEFLDPFGKAQKFDKAESADQGSAHMDVVSAGMMEDEEEDDPASAEVRRQMSAMMSQFALSEDDDEGGDFLDLDNLDLNRFDLESLMGQLEQPEVPEPVSAAEPENDPDVVRTSREEEMRIKAYNAKEDLKYIVQHGSRSGIHFLLLVNSYLDFKQIGVREEAFRHRFSFRIAAEESTMLMGTKAASELPEHVCLYTDTVDRFSFRPYLHREISWDGWSVDKNGVVVSPFE